MSADIKAHFAMVRAALDDAEVAALNARDDDGLTAVGKLVRSLVIDCDRANYSRDVAQKGQAAAEARLKALQKRVAELMDLVDEGDVGANIDTSLSDPQPGKLLVVRIDDDDARYMRRRDNRLEFFDDQFVGWLEGGAIGTATAGDEGDTETKPVDVAALTGGADVVAMPHPGPMTFDPMAKLVMASGSPTLLPTAPKPTCHGCRSVEGRGHFAGCEGGAL